MKFYTGVGSRKAPLNILGLMTKIAIFLNKQGWVLRSGGADGSDLAFEKGAGNLKEIYYANDANKAAMEIAGLYHPAWHQCGEYARKLHGRNAFQVLGSNLDTPSRFLVCWTPDGCRSHQQRTIKTGGTGTAISIASNHNVKVFNLANNVDRERIEFVINPFK